MADAVVMITLRSSGRPGSISNHIPDTGCASGVLYTILVYLSSLRMKLSSNASRYISQTDPSRAPKSISRVDAEGSWGDHATHSRKTPFSLGRGRGFVDREWR